MDDTQGNNPPRDVLRDGNLKASIWRNEGEKGPFYSVNLARTYRDEQGTVRDAHSFSGGDLLRVSELARKTYDRTQELRREDRQAERQQDAPLLDRHERGTRRESFRNQRDGQRAPNTQADRGR